MREETSSVLFERIRAAPTMPATWNNVSAAFSYVFVAPGGIESENVAGLGLLCPDRRNAIVNSAASVGDGLVIQIVVKKRLPPTPSTRPTAGRTRSVPPNPAQPGGMNEPTRMKNSAA